MKKSLLQNIQLTQKSNKVEKQYLSKKEQDFDQFLYQADFNYQVLPKEAYQPCLLQLNDTQYELDHQKRSYCHSIWSINYSPEQQIQFYQILNNIKYQNHSDKFFNSSCNKSKEHQSNNINNNSFYQYNQQQDNFQEIQISTDTSYFSNSSCQFTESQEYQQDLNQNILTQENVSYDIFKNLSTNQSNFAKKIEYNIEEENLKDKIIHNNSNSINSTRLPTHEDEITSTQKLDQSIFEKLQPLQDQTQNYNNIQPLQEQENQFPKNSQNISNLNEAFQQKINPKEEEIRKELENLEQDSEQMCQLLSSNDKIKYKSAFKLFKLDFIAKLKEKQPNLDFRARTSLLKEMWKNQTQEEKLQYVKKSRIDKIRAIKDLTQ